MDLFPRHKDITGLIIQSNSFINLKCNPSIICNFSLTSLLLIFVLFWLYLLSVNVENYNCITKFHILTEVYYLIKNYYNYITMH